LLSTSSCREDGLAYVSRPKKAIRKRTSVLYIDAIPYDHLQLLYAQSSGRTYAREVNTDLVLAMRKPNAKGEREAEMRKPRAQILS